MGKQQRNIFDTIKSSALVILLFAVMIVQNVMPRPGTAGYNAEAQGTLLWWLVAILAYAYLGFALLERIVKERYNDQYGGVEVLDCEVYLNKLAPPADFYHLVASKDLLAISTKDFDAVLADPLYEWSKNRVILEETIRRLEAFLARMEDGVAGAKGKGEVKVAKKIDDDKPLRQLIEQVAAKKLSKQQIEEEIRKTHDQLLDCYDKRELKEDGNTKAEGVRTFIYYVKLQDEDTIEEVTDKGKRVPVLKFKYILMFLPLSWNNTFSFRPGKLLVKGYEVKAIKAKCAFVKVGLLKDNTPTYKCTYCAAYNSEQIDESISSQQIIDLQKLALSRMVLELKHDMEDSGTEIRKYQARADYFKRKNDDVLGMYEEDVRPVDDFTTSLMQQMWDNNHQKTQKKTYWWVGAIIATIGIIAGIMIALKL